MNSANKNVSNSALIAAAAILFYFGALSDDVGGYLKSKLGLLSVGGVSSSEIKHASVSAVNDPWMKAQIESNHPEEFRKTAAEMHDMFRGNQIKTGFDAVNK